MVRFRRTLAVGLALAVATSVRGDESPVLTEAAAAEAIAKLVSDKQPRTPKVLALSSSAGGIVAVSVEPPYRDFPNVVLFRFNSKKLTWARLPEAFVLGLQDKRTTLLDLHTTGLAVDFSIPPSDRQKYDRLRADGRKSGLVFVEYRHFFHMHPAGPEEYKVDKSAYYDLAQRLFPNGRYEKVYPHDACTMYDVPTLLSVTLKQSSAGWLLTGETDNGQVWTVTFDAIDEDGNLRGKRIEARLK